MSATSGGNSTMIVSPSRRTVTASPLALSTRATG